MRIARGAPGTWNTLVADRPTGQIGDDGEPVFDVLHDKIRKAAPDTYFACVGDAFLAEVVTDLVEWHDPKPLDVAAASTFAAAMAGLCRLRAARQLQGMAIASDPGVAALAVCTPRRAVIWQAAFDNASDSFGRPTMTELGAGEVRVLRGVTNATTSGVVLAGDDHVPAIVGAMRAVNAQLEGQGYPCHYPFDDRCSAVSISHGKATRVRRTRPFDSLPEKWARYRGGSALRLVDDPEFHKLE